MVQNRHRPSTIDNLQTLDKQSISKTLGILWDSVQDQLKYEIKLSQQQASTKHGILSNIAQIFDPLGLIGPILVIGKILMQRLWSDTTDWEQMLSYDYLINWNNYYFSLS